MVYLAIISASLRFFLCHPIECGIKLSYASTTLDLKWYYITELSFYMALMATHFTDTKRKDFIQQFVHHIATIVLIAGSYCIAHFRYGT